MSSPLQTLLPVGVGVAVVVAGILVFRLHAFFALLLAAAATAGLTSDDLRWRNELERRSVLKRDASSGRSLVSIQVPDATFLEVYPREAEFGRPAVAALRPKHVFMPFAGPIGFAEDGWPNLNDPLRTFGIDVEPQSYTLSAADFLVTHRDSSEAFEAVSRPVAARIALAFGDTVGSIGLLIAFAAVIGMCLLDSGAADRIVRSALKLVGERGAPAAFMSCGFLLGVPVFFDTVFLLLIPLGKALRLRTGRNYVLYVLTIFCGATMAHSLVPPTPGPLLVAERLGVNVGTMIVVGSAVGLIVATYGVLHAWVANRFVDVPLRDTPDMPLAELERLAARPDHELPPLWASLLPIALPLVLIAQAATLEVLRKNDMTVFGDVIAMSGWQMTLIETLGEKTTAVGIGLVAALVLLMRQSRQTLGQLQGRVGAALASGGSIILITAAGGAFGQMIEQTGVASLVKDLPGLGPVGLLAVAFGVTAAIRTAQGSATVAMITVVGIFAGVSLPFHPVWLALAIGCGSKPLSWMPDSGFWVICRMSGMTEAETLKTLTPMTGMLGLVGLATVIAGATVFPMK